MVECLICFNSVLFYVYAMAPNIIYTDFIKPCNILYNNQKMKSSLLQFAYLESSLTLVVWIGILLCDDSLNTAMIGLRLTNMRCHNLFILSLVQTTYMLAYVILVLLLDFIGFIHVFILSIGCTLITIH